MNLKVNTLANYIGQGYSALAGILIVPFYISKLGISGYGLVGIYIMLQGWLQLLDLGLSNTVSREASLSRIGIDKRIEFQTFFRVIQYFFIVFGFLFLAISLFNVGFLSKEWIESDINTELLSEILILMLFGVLFRWLCGPYRGVMIGYEKFIIINIVNIIITTLRYPISLLVLYLNDNDLYSFFFYQMFTSFAEFFLYYLAAKKVSDSGFIGMEMSKFNPECIKIVLSKLKIALSIASTSVIWVLVTQVDKLIVSNVVSLEEFGYYSVAIVASSGLLLISQPIGQAILPRLSYLYGKDEIESFRKLYINTTKLMITILVPVSFILFIYSEEILILWTREKEVAMQSWLFFSLYLIGNLFLAVSAFPYYLQYSMGNLKLHIYGTLNFLAILLISLYYLVPIYGALGAASSWLFVNLIYFLIWTSYVHYKLDRVLLFRWINYGVWKPALPYVLFLILMLTFKLLEMSYFSVLTLMVTFFVIYKELKSNLEGLR